jgi:hypothetical protein
LKGKTHGKGTREEKRKDQSPNKRPTPQWGARRGENMKARTSKIRSFELILPRGMEEPRRHGEEERIQDYPQIVTQFPELY